MSLVQGAIYEARTAEDVEFFIAHNPEENGALMFYDASQEQDPAIARNVDKVLGVYRNIGEEGRSQEEWVNQLNDKVHMMRIEATKKENAKSVDEYKVSKTPLLVLLDFGKIQLMEVLSDKSFEHIKDYYATIIAKRKAEAEEKAKQEQAKQEAAASNGTAGAGGKETSKSALENAQKAAEEAKKAADQALKALEETRKAFEEHLQQQHKDEAGAKGGSSDPSKQGADEKCGTPPPKPEKPKEEKCDTGSSNQPAENPQGYQIEYIPVYKRLDQPNAPGIIAPQSQGSKRYVSHGDHWHIVGN